MNQKTSVRAGPQKRPVEVAVARVALVATWFGVAS
jgi:hypothetical protein